MRSIRRKSPFTLLELIVVMSIIFLAAAMSVAVFRDQSPAKKLETASLEWRAFCSGVRYRALEAGSERQILFDPEERIFRMYDPSEAEKEEEDSSSDEKKEDPDSEEESPFPKAKRFSSDLQWKLPEGFELGDFPSPEEEPDVENSFLLFTFYGDGSASGKRKLELRCGEQIGRIFEISALTGRLTVRDMSEEELHGISSSGETDHEK